MSEHRFESTPFEIVALRDAVMLLQHIARSKIGKWYLKIGSLVYYQATEKIT